MSSMGQCSNSSVGPANGLFNLLMTTLLAAQCSISPPEMWPTNYANEGIENGFSVTYDFIIVGAGSAGAVMANRLSENPDWNILLLEAGGDPPIESMIPALLFTLEKTASDWAYFAEPSTTGALGTEHGAFWPRGKMLGGCSGINALIYVRGNRRDYDGWAAAVGQQSGWDYDSVLPYFIKSEDNGDMAADDPFHGRGGPLKVNFFEDVLMSVRQMLRNGLTELGYAWLDDVNGAHNLGFSRLQGTVKNGTRSSTAAAFLAPIAHQRPNLHVVKNAQATRLLYADEAGERVNGVEFRLAGIDRPFEARTTKEVILSAGALNTPQILLLSGIGPQAQLDDLQIPVRHRLAVGENLQDHLIVPYLMGFHRSTAQSSDMRSNVDDYFDYVTKRSGRLATILLTDFGGFVNTLNDSAYPDIQYLMVHMPRGHPQWEQMLRLYGYTEDIIVSLVDANANVDIVMWAVTLLNPQSIGRVELRSDDPMATPKITHNYFEQQADVETVVRGIRLIQKFETTAAYAADEGESVRPKLTVCDALVADSDAYWQCYARYMAVTLYHPTSTATMGTDPIAGAVVDSELRVHGVQGLRVVDASVMPAIVSGNTNAPTIMIAEKAADFVKAAYE